jgi:hypothetical protein
MKEALLVVVAAVAATAIGTVDVCEPALWLEGGEEREEEKGKKRNFGFLAATFMSPHLHFSNLCNSPK